MWSPPEVTLGGKITITDSKALENGELGLLFLAEKSCAVDVVMYLLIFLLIWTFDI